jgi:DNA end-binding protein Ku
MRAIWSGSLAFGLINIPVRIYSASEERALKFKLLDKHGHCPISYAKVCRGTNKEVKYEDIVKGYEYQKGDFVILTDEDFKKAAPKKTKAIEIVSFTDESEVESKYINKPYFIEPDSKAEKAYVLLREALRKSKKAGIARYVFKDKEHIGLIKPEGNALMLIELRFEDELRKPEDLKIPGKAEYSQKELDIALMLINQLEEHFNASEYHDTYTEALKKVIEKKAEGKPIKVSKDAEPVPTDMRNLMSMLKQSLEQAKK